MGRVSVSYRNRGPLIDEGRWDDLLALATHGRVDGDEATPGERFELAHAVALKAPPALAAAAAELYPDDDRGAFGPLWEVVAHRPWRELDPHLTHPRVRRLVAQTRVLYGEDLRGVVESEIPLRLERWEAAHFDPEWHLPAYDLTGSSSCTIWHFPHWLIENLPGGIPLPAAAAVRVAHPAVPILRRLNHPERLIGAHAFRATAWEAAATVADDREPHRVAATTTGERETCRAAEVPFAEAYRHLVFLASGSAAYPTPHGAGTALGRLALWRVLSVMAGGDPVPAFVERLRCVTWRRPLEQMWTLHLAMEDPHQRLAWTLTASDSD